MARSGRRTFEVSADLSAWQGYSRPALRGALRYAAGAPHWELHSTLSEHQAPPGEQPGAARQRMDGRIIWAMNAGYRREIRRTGMKVVAIRDRFEQDRVPTVVPDNFATGAMAAEYLLGLGFRRFAMVGELSNEACRHRFEGFRETATGHGGEAAVTPIDAEDLQAAPEAAADWLRAMRPPCGAFCWTDNVAHAVIRVARTAGIAVPDDLAVIGVHNDDLVCESIRPSISSVALPMERVGYEAAALLDRLLHGESEPDGPIRLPPVGVVERNSTRTMAIEDPAVLQAVAIIRDQAIEGLTVERLCEQMDPPVSRRTLERRFQRTLGRSPHQEIRRQQCHHACTLLIDSRLTQEQIARRCGFSSTPFFSNTFTRIIGVRPGAFRRQRQDR